jgi:hypothetical protein
MKTLKEYHKKYPARAGDTAQKFADYEEFCRRYPSPPPTGDYLKWYSYLSMWMQALEYRDNKNKK